VGDGRAISREPVGDQGGVITGEAVLLQPSLVCLVDDQPADRSASLETPFDDGDGAVGTGGQVSESPAVGAHREAAGVALLRAEHTGCRGACRDVGGDDSPDQWLHSSASRRSAYATSLQRSVLTGCAGHSGVPDSESKPATRASVEPAPVLEAPLPTVIRS
jgi:hypothetical protein